MKIGDVIENEFGKFKVMEATTDHGKHPCEGCSGFDYTLKLCAWLPDCEPEDIEGHIVSHYIFVKVEDNK